MAVNGTKGDVSGRPHRGQALARRTQVASLSPTHISFKLANVAKNGTEDVHLIDGIVRKSNQFRKHCHYNLHSVSPNTKGWGLVSVWQGQSHSSVAD